MDDGLCCISCCRKPNYKCILRCKNQFIDFGESILQKYFLKVFSKYYFILYLENTFVKYFILLFSKYFFCTILFSIFKILLKSILPITIKCNCISGRCRPKRNGGQHLTSTHCCCRYWYMYALFRETSHSIVFLKIKFIDGNHATQN
jgi:hypothetical protein